MGEPLPVLHGVQSSAVNHQTSSRSSSVRKMDVYQTRREESMAALYQKDKDVANAFYHLFERNDIAECERRLQGHTQDISSTFSIALIVFLRYIFSLEKKAAGEALEKVEVSCAKSAEIFSKTSSLLSGIRALRRQRGAAVSDTLTAAEFRAKFLHAMSVLLLGVLHMTQQSIAGVMKGVMTLRDGYKKLKELEQLAEEDNDNDDVVPDTDEDNDDDSGEDEYDDSGSYGSGGALAAVRRHRAAAERKRTGVAGCKSLDTPNSSLSLDKPTASLSRCDGLYDANSVNGLYLGLGVFRTLLSLLRPRMASMASMVGFDEGNYDEGMRLLHRSYRSQTLYSPFSALAILVTRTQRCRCCPFVAAEELKAVREVEKAIIRSELTRSALHLWPLAAIQRLRLQLDESIDLSTKCIALTGDGSNWTQSFSSIRVNAMEDHALSLVIRGDWLEAYNTFLTLEEESSWSRLVFVYCQACCLEMMLHETRKEGKENTKLIPMITAAYWRAAHRKNIVFGARSKSVDFLVIKRVAEILQVAGVKHPNPTHQKRFEEVTPLSPRVTLRNIVSLPGYELLIFFNCCHQVPMNRVQHIVGELDDKLQWLAHQATNDTTVALANIVDMESFQPRVSRHSAERVPVHCNLLPDGANMMALLAVKAGLQVYRTTYNERVEASRLIEHVTRIISPLPMFRKEEDTMCSLSYIVPFLLFSDATVSWFSGEIYKSNRLLMQYAKRYKGRAFYLVDEFELGVTIAMKVAQKKKEALEKVKR